MVKNDNHPHRPRRSTFHPTRDLAYEMRALKYVIAAADHGSFSAAAAALNIKSSTVSRHIREFESRIGTPLFNRSRVGVNLTKVGQFLIEDTSQAAKRLEAALNQVYAAGRLETGHLRIGLITTLGGGFLRMLVEAFRAEFGDIALEFREGGRTKHLRAIRSRNLDLAFFTGNARIPDLAVLDLWRERVHVALARSHPLANQKALDWPQLRGERFITTFVEPGPEVHAYIIRRLADYSTYPEVLYHDVSTETLIHMVALGEGITLVSEGWTDTTYQNLVLRPLTAKEDIVPFRAVWAPGNENPALHGFLDFARKLVDTPAASRYRH